MTITSQLKEEGDNPTRVYGMECGGVAKAQVDNVGMKRTLCDLVRGAHAVPPFRFMPCRVIPDRSE